jgi:type IV pilus assembly protein PilF
MLKPLFIVVLCAILLACTSAQEREYEEKNKYRIADTNVRLGVGYLRQGRVEAALEKLLKALKAVPDYPEAHSSIALIYERLGETEKAGNHYRQALEIKPEDGPIHNNYAVYLCNTGKPLEAEKHFLQAIKSRGYRTLAQALENLGVCAMQIPDIEKAETYLRQALQMDKRLPGALLQMARVSYEKGRFMSGRAYLQRYQEVTAMGPEGLWLGIQVEKKLGDTNAVREYEARLFKKYPDSNETRKLLEAQTSRGAKTL